MKKFKRLWMTILIIVLSVSIMIGGTTLLSFGADAAPSTLASAEVFAATNLPTSVKLGEYIDLGVAANGTGNASTNVSIFDPSGENITENGKQSYQATMNGNYIITYKGGSQEYTYNVSCKSDAEYEFRIVDGGASIPTFIKSKTTAGTAKEKVTLPKGYLYKKASGEDEFKIMKEGVDYTLTVEDNGEDITNKLENYSFPAGNHTVKYIARLTGSSKFFYEEFTVKAQSDFKDTTAPTLSIVGMPTTASLNTKVTLPKATATDDFDTNVRVDITVKFNDKKVKVATVNKNSGFATGYELNDENEEIEVVFDNAHNLFFYPRELDKDSSGAEKLTGIYKVEYQAFDDYGNPSVVYSQNITVSDSTAPTLDEIADDKIPTTWAKSIYNDKDNKNDFVTDRVINFPYPTYIDNVNDTSDLTVSFEIRDTVNNNTVIKFANIYNQGGDGAKYKYSANVLSNGLYDNKGLRGDNGTYTFDKVNGFDFRFDDYYTQVDSKLTTTGKYTVIYQARDKTPNITTKTYEITLENEIKAYETPTIDFSGSTNLSYVYVTEKYETLKLGFPSIKDSNGYDTRLTNIYKLEGNGEGTEEILVKPEDTIEIKQDGDDVKVRLNNDDATIKTLAGDMIFFKVTSKNDYVDEIEDDQRNIAIINKAIIQHETGAKVSVSGLTVTPTTEDGKVKVGEEFTFGNLELNKGTPVKFANYIGFELTVIDEEGDIVKTSLETYIKLSDDGTTCHIGVDKIRFVPSFAGTYKMYVRAFDASNRSAVKVFSITAEGTVVDDDDIIGIPNEQSFAKIPEEGTVNTTYILNNQTIKGTAHANYRYVVRKITNAGSFRLMGVEFTPLSDGSFSFNDGLYELDNNSDASFKSYQKYTLVATETAAVTLEFMNPVQTYYAKDSTIILPKVYAYSEFSNVKAADVKIVVKTPSPNSKTLTVGSEVTFNENTGRYSFKADRDGTYTITFNASIGSSELATRTVSIKVGDIVAPVITVGDQATSATQNSKFAFKTIGYNEADNDGESAKNITFTKKIYFNNEVVYTVSGVGIDYANKNELSTGKYVFEKTGVYTIEYTATDEAGNSTIIKHTVTVSVTGSSSSIPLKVLSTVLIIVGVLLIAGVVLYFIRFRKVKDPAKAKETVKA